MSRQKKPGELEKIRQKEVFLISYEKMIYYT
jgi:hypothetical protein